MFIHICIWNTVELFDYINSMSYTKNDFTLSFTWINLQIRLNPSLEQEHIALIYHATACTLA